MSVDEEKNVGDEDRELKTGQGSLQRISEIEQELTRLASLSQALREEKQRLVNAEAQKVAEFQIGEEVQMRRGQELRRYRVSRIQGDYYNFAPNQHKFIARHFGRLVKKGGDLAEGESSLYGAKKVSPESAQRPGSARPDDGPAS